MNAKELKAKIKANTIPNLLIFTGEEIQVARIYKNKIATTLNLPIIYCDTVAEVYKKIINSSFIINNACYVVLEDKDIITNEKGLLAIKEKLKNNILILQYDKLDKRCKFYKQNEVYEFEKLDIDLLIKYIQKECDMNISNCQKLIEVCENDYSRILLELDKIKNYEMNVINCKQGYSRKDIAFEQLLKDRTIYQPPYDAIFDFVDAVLKRQVTKAFDLLKISYELGENTLTLLSALYINTKQVIQVQCCEAQDVSKNTGLTPWQIKCTMEKINYYSVEELLNILDLIGETERGIKSGTVNDDIAMNNLLVNIF